ncbi:MAG: DEAD/DEAH box helicase [Planctomycetaceae bacterium]|jgi:SNF2 family DNA or RNA helicase|nr:DEAD/DEAH box helicase [Planctomycetaceae bacterium]
MLSHFFSQLRNKTAVAAAPFKPPQISCLRLSALLPSPPIAGGIFTEIPRLTKGRSLKVLLDAPVVSPNLGLIIPPVQGHQLLTEQIAGLLDMQAEIKSLSVRPIHIIDVPADYPYLPAVNIDFGRITTPRIHDLTEKYRGFHPVKIISIPLLTLSRIDGKAYQTKAYKHPTDIPPRERKPSGRSSEQREKIKVPFSIWDFLFPILHLPLGEGLNNAFAFPAGKMLYPFQAEGVRFLINRPSALLGDEMGLGKSIQVITAIRLLYRQGKMTSVGIVCPKAVLSDWAMKFSEWSPELRIIKVSGNRFERAAQWQTPAHVHICTYESLRNDWKIVEKLPQQRQSYSTSAHHFDLIVLDEIQKTKNPAAKLTKTVRDLQTSYRWGLSGTPLENGIQDLITICETLKPGIFIRKRILNDGYQYDVRNYTDLLNRCSTIYTEGYGYNTDIIKLLYQPIFLRRRVKDVMKEMPEKITHEVWLDLPRKQREAYTAAEQSGITELKKMGTKITLQHVLGIINKLKQICNYYGGESVKLEHLQEKLGDLTEEGNKALVFSQYPNETLRRIEPELQKFNPVIYDGSLSDARREKVVNNFQHTDDNQVMLLSLKAGNAGITLTRANYIYHFDMWWNPAVMNQAVGRVLRIGQTKTVFERFLLTKGTIEEKIYRKVQQKQVLFNEAVDDLSDESVALRNLTEDEIFGLLGLTKIKKKEN